MAKAGADCRCSLDVTGFSCSSAWCTRFALAEECERVEPDVGTTVPLLRKPARKFHARPRCCRHHVLSYSLSRQQQQQGTYRREARAFACSPSLWCSSSLCALCLVHLLAERTTSLFLPLFSLFLYISLPRAGPLLCNTISSNSYVYIPAERCSVFNRLIHSFIQFTLNIYFPFKSISNNNKLPIVSFNS